ncbi:GDP-mannose 4,6-dehydratase [bacterium]|nr:GDP-mannose 4,6-dehydratase [bacterium]
MTDWQGRRVLVTGIYGFLASHLAEELLARGAAVIGLYRDRPVDSYLQLSGLEERVALVQGDITDLEACRRIVNEHEVQVVFHLAAQAIVGLANRSPYSTLESNVRGTYTLLEACRELRERGLVEAIVVASSDKAYGDQPELPYQEQAPLLGLHPYDASKSCADLLARMFAHTYGLPVAVTRCANLYGPGDPSPSRIVPATMLSLMRGERPIIRSDGSPLRDYLFVRDAVGAYLALAQAVAEGPAAGRAYNIGTGVPVSVLELVKQIVAVSGVDLPPEVQNTASGEIVHQYLDVRRAAEEIGWRATTPLAEGLGATYTWYKSIHDRHS